MVRLGLSQGLESPSGSRVHIPRDQIRSVFGTATGQRAQSQCGPKSEGRAVPWASQWRKTAEEGDPH